MIATVDTSILTARMENALSNILNHHMAVTATVREATTKVPEDKSRENMTSHSRRRKITMSETPSWAQLLVSWAVLS
jgi:hypothetical protein